MKNAVAPLRFSQCCLVSALAALGAGTASADIIYETPGPFGGPFGLIGFDVCIDQSVAVRFEPASDYTLDKVSVWLMNNIFSGPGGQTVVVTIRTDDDTTPGVSVPSNTILEKMTLIASATGWSPVLESVNSVSHPLLSAGVKYWVVLESVAPCGEDPVWNWATGASGYTSNTSGSSVWQPGGMGAVAATIVEGSPVTSCFADCDNSGSLDFFDFLCFQNEFANGTAYADCDGSGTLDFFDFLCFQNAFAAGCP